MENKISGAIYGLALGDAMGMPSELWGRERVRNYFGEITEFLDGPAENEVACHYSKGQFTYDTGQALVILDSLKETNYIPNTQHLAKRLLQWADHENAFDKNMLGPTTKVALTKFREGKDAKAFTDKSLSNGSAMRISPIGCLFKPSDKERLARYVYQVSRVTHTSDITIAGAAMIAMGVSSALINEDFSKVLTDIYDIEKIARSLGKETFSPSLSERTKLGVELANTYKFQDKLFLEKIYDLIGAGVNISESVPAAISIAYYAQDPNKSALLCANLAGDTDTIGAMSTSICGAFTGMNRIEKKYIDTLNKANSVNLSQYVDDLLMARGRLQ